MASNFSWTNATLEDYLRKMYGLPPLVYMLIILVLLLIIMMCVFARYKESYLETTSAPTPSNTTPPPGQGPQLSAIDETPELLINPESTLERKKILETIRGQIHETSPLRTARPGISRTPKSSASRKEEAIPLVQMRQKLQFSSTITFSPRRKLRLSDDMENVDEEQVAESSQPTSPGSVEITVSPPDTPTRRQSLRLKEKKSKDKGD